MITQFQLNLNSISTQSIKMGEPAPPSIPVNKPSFNWESTNLHETFKLLRNQVKILLVEGQYSPSVMKWTMSEPDLVMEPGEDKRKCEDVLKAFEHYFKPTQSLFQNW